MFAVNTALTHIGNVSYFSFIVNISFIILSVLRPKAVECRRLSVKSKVWQTLATFSGWRGGWWFSDKYLLDTPDRATTSHTFRSFEYHFCFPTVVHRFCIWYCKHEKKMTIAANIFCDNSTKSSTTALILIATMFLCVSFVYCEDNGTEVGLKNSKRNAGAVRVCGTKLVNTLKKLCNHCYREPQLIRSIRGNKLWLI